MRNKYINTGTHTGDKSIWRLRALCRTPHHSGERDDDRAAFIARDDRFLFLQRAVHWQSRQATGASFPRIRVPLLQRFVCALYVQSPPPEKQCWAVLRRAWGQRRFEACGGGRRLEMGRWESEWPGIGDWKWYVEEGGRYVEEDRGARGIRVVGGEETDVKDVKKERAPH